jgi:hypothetical protein
MKSGRSLPGEHRSEPASGIADGIGRADTRLTRAPHESTRLTIVTVGPAGLLTGPRRPSDVAAQVVPARDVGGGKDADHTRR